jgi:hypothetical protein
MQLFNNKRYKFIPYVGLVLLAAFLVKECFREGDFKVFLDAAKTLKEHHSMYGIWLNEGSAKYFYSPLFALILMPFIVFPAYVISFIWLCANVYFLVRIWKFISLKLDITVFTKKELYLFLVIALLLSMRFLLYNFDNIQMTIFLLWAIFESLLLFEKGKNKSGAFLLALAINIKLMPIVIIPYLLLRKRFIPVLWIVAFSIVLLYLPALFLGFEFNNFLIREWGKVINPLNNDNSIDASYGVQGLTPWLATLLMKTTGGELSYKRNIAELDMATVNWVINIARAAFIVFTLYFTGFTFFKKAKSKLRMFWELSYIVLIAPLVFPHQQKYAFFLAAPALTYMAYFIVYHYHSKFKCISYSRWVFVIVLVSLSFILNTLTSDMFIGYHWSQITQHYKSITYGTIIVVIALALCRPSYIEDGIERSIV